MDIKKAILSALTPNNRQISGDETHQKAFIPSLASLDSFWGIGMGGRIKDFKRKPEQIEANMGWVFAANDAIAEACASVEIKLYQKKKDGEREEIFEHEILDLLETPNLAHTGEQLKQLHFTYMNLVGESFLLKMMGDKPAINPLKLPQALHVLPSHNAEFKLGDDYGSSTVVIGDEIYPITAVLRDLKPDPKNPYKGRSIIAAAAATIDTDEQMKQWNRRVFANSARPSAIIEVPDTMEDKAFKRFKQQTDDAATGTDAAFKPMILEGGAKVSPYMMTQQDLDFLNSRKFSKDEILAMFRVSPAMLGMTENINRSNAETAEYVFAKYVVLPRVRQFTKMLNSMLVKPFDKSLELDFVNPVPDDVEARRSDASAGVDKWWTIDEVRALYGEEPLAGGLGGQLYRPVNEVPLSMIGSPTAAADNGDTANADGGAGGAAEAGKSAGTPKKKEIADPRKARGDAKALVYTRNAEQYEKIVMMFMRKEFDWQMGQVLTAIDKNKLDKAFYSKKSLDDLINWLEANSRMEKGFKPILSTIIADTGVRAMLEVTNGMQFDPFAALIVQFYDARATMIAQDVNAETEKQLKATLAEGITAGETTYELKARVQNVFGNIGTMRAIRIAQSEVTRAQGFADVAAWQQSGVVEGKEWYTAHDSHVDPFCADMDGREIDLTETFYTKGDSMTVTNDKGKEVTRVLNYEDIEHPPLHVGCRCVLIPIRKQV